MSSVIRQALYVATLAGSLLLPGCTFREPVREQVAVYVPYSTRTELESLLVTGLSRPENRRALRGLYEEMQRDGIERGGFFGDGPGQVEFHGVRNTLQDDDTLFKRLRERDLAAWSLLESRITLAESVRSINQRRMCILTPLRTWISTALHNDIPDEIWDAHKNSYQIEVRQWMYCADDTEFQEKSKYLHVLAHVHYHSRKMKEPRDDRAVPNQASRIDEQIGHNRPEVVMVPHDGALEAWLTWRGAETFIGSIPLDEPSALVGPALLEK